MPSTILDIVDTAETKINNFYFYLFKIYILVSNYNMMSQDTARLLTSIRKNFTEEEISQLKL